MARKKLVAGNWKMHRGDASACTLAEEIAAGSGALPAVSLLVAPPFTALAAVAEVLHGSSVGLAGQNLHPADHGAFTGEVSGPMLAACGCRAVLVGHSERRQFFGDTDALVEQKARAALRAGLHPVVCVGETLGERESGRTLEVVRRQLSVVLEVVASAPGSVVIAYEPVWAIGTGKVAGPDQAEEVHAALRATLGEHDPALAEQTLILYGGSVKEDNAASLFACPNVDGALVGGASLSAPSFLAIAAAAAG